jgi:hypothetical protein
MPVGWGGIPLGPILSAYCPPYSEMLIMELRSRYFHHTGESLENLRCILKALQKPPSYEPIFHRC